MEAHYYTVKVAWSRDRRGMMWSPEFDTHGTTNKCIEVATPPEFPKGVAGVWSPEHLLTGAVSSCFMTTFLAVAEHSKLAFTSFSCHAQGKLDTVDGKLQMTEILLTPSVYIESADDREKALRVLAKTEQACPITHSLKAAVKVTMVVETR
ncbi:OsmC family protein [Dawidia soli]|uniref:OsmC family protein n=1 Tax=Dawidia soli TaxID=2782352 RepID=A0AAP2DF74_9BACT|nr:OsmC family protein [Dawidia soli]MBT1690733.1 OsmC family protein [Dawidia soli]